MIFHFILKLNLLFISIKISNYKTKFKALRAFCDWALNWLLLWMRPDGARTHGAHRGWTPTPLNIFTEWMNKWKKSSQLTNEIYRINVMDTMDVNNRTTDVDIFLVVELHSLNWQMRQLIGAVPLFARTHVWCIVSAGATQPRTTSVLSPTDGKGMVN